MGCRCRCSGPVSGLEWLAITVCQVALAVVTLSNWKRVDRG